MNQHRLDGAATCLKQGGTLLYPTEAVYGLGCLPTHLPAIERILQIKGREAGKGLILIAARLSQLAPWIAPLDEQQTNLISLPTTRATTWLVPAARHISPLVTGGRETVAIRITQFPIARSLCQQLNSALISTSANFSGQAACSSFEEIPEAILSEVGWAINAPCGGELRPSQIIDLQTKQIIRG